jgi:SPFH domain / Band 7 family
MTTYVSRLSRIRAGHVGIVHRNFGRYDPREKFGVRLYESVGPQVDLLRAGAPCWQVPLTAQVEEYPMIRVPAGTIGVVNALIGEPCPPGQKCRSVPCDSFQDARAFLEGGGQSGRQLESLPAGIYGIHPGVFEVLTVDNIGRGKYGVTADDLGELSVPVGRTGVVITLAGEAPDDVDGAVGRKVPGHECFQLASVFLANGGQRGAQEQTLGQGAIYQINPWFARVELIPARELLLEWTAKKKPPSNFDASLDEIEINIEGHRIRFDMAQVIRIPAEAAPRLVGRFGEQEEDVYGSSNAAEGTPVRRFVERVLSRTVETYFQDTATAYKVLDFLDQLDDVRLSLEDKVRETLAELGIEAVRTTLSRFRSQDGDLDDLRKKIAFARDRRRILESEQENADIENEMLKRRAEAEAYAKTAAEIQLLDAQIRLLGSDQVAKERFLRQLTRMKVPNFVGGDAAQLLHYMPYSQALELITNVQKNTQKRQIEPPEAK